MTTPTTTHSCHQKAPLSHSLNATNNMILHCLCPAPPMGHLLSLQPPSPFLHSLPVLPGPLQQLSWVPHTLWPLLGPLNWPHPSMTHLQHTSPCALTCPAHCPGHSSCYQPC